MRPCTPADFRRILSRALRAALAALAEPDEPEADATPADAAPDPLGAWLATLTPGHTGTAAEWLPAWQTWAREHGEADPFARPWGGDPSTFGRALARHGGRLAWRMSRRNVRVYTVREPGRVQGLPG